MSWASNLAAKSSGAGVGGGLGLVVSCRGRCCDPDKVLLETGGLFEAVVERLPAKDAATSYA